MKTIQYKLYQGTDESGNVVTASVVLGYSAANEEIAKSEAYEGKYDVIDDGAADTREPTTEERIEALEAAMLEMIMGVDANG